MDRLGTDRITIGGLVVMLIGCSLLAVVPSELGVAGYVAPLVVATAGYALFQAANKTAVMAEIGSDQRGVVSGMLILSRNLGLVTGSFVIGAVFAIASGATDVTMAHRDAIASGKQVACAVTTSLILLALIIAIGSRAAAARSPQSAAEA